MTDEELEAELKKLAEAAEAAGAEMFMGVPDRWYARFTVRCRKDHVSTMVLKTGTGSRCLECGQRVFLTFPEDQDGTPLRRSQSVAQAQPEEPNK